MKVILEELRYCKRGSYQAGYLVEPDTVEFVEDEYFKGRDKDFTTLEEAIEYAKKICESLYGVNRHLTRVSVVNVNVIDEDCEIYDYDYLWVSTP